MPTNCTMRIFEAAQNLVNLFKNGIMRWYRSIRATCPSHSNTTRYRIWHTPSTKRAANPSPLTRNRHCHSMEVEEEASEHEGSSRSSSRQHHPTTSPTHRPTNSPSVAPTILEKWKCHGSPFAYGFKSVCAQTATTLRNFGAQTNKIMFKIGRILTIVVGI
jgi:hypothetical protein